MLAKDTSALPGHHCYACLTRDALEHIAKEGAPREIIDHCVFDCRAKPPSALNPKIKVDSFLTFETLEEALLQLHKQPIGATLIEFTELWTLGKVSLL